MILLSSSSTNWESIGVIIGIVIVYYIYSSKQKQKRLAEEEELEAKKRKELQKSNAESKNSVRAEEVLEKVAEINAQIQDIERIEIGDVTDLKIFIKENEGAIVTKGGENKLFEFLKIEVFLSDYRRKIISDVEMVKSHYSSGRIEVSILEQENLLRLYRGGQQFNEIIRTFGSGISTNSEIFRILGQLKPSIEAQVATLEFYKSLSLAMILFYLDDKKIRFFEIYQAFEKLGVFDSSWQKNVATKLESIDLRLAHMNEQMTQLNENFSRLADNTEHLTSEIKAGFKDIGARINVNNVLTGITAYQTYRINKGIQRQNAGNLS